MAVILIAVLLTFLPWSLGAFVRPSHRPEHATLSLRTVGKASRGRGDPGYVKTGIQRNLVSSTDKTIVPRWGREPLSEFQYGVVYLMSINVGSPRQNLTVIVDTGSWELYLNPNCQRAADETFCTNSGHYSPTSSSTATDLTSRFYVSFGTGGYVGEYYSDTLWFGDDYWPITNLQFGVADDSDYVWAGILGLGYGKRFNTKYSTLIDLMVSEKYISVPIFSMAVGSQGAGSGEIILAGVDTHNYQGWLEPLELSPPPATQITEWQQVQYWVTLTSLGYTAPGQSMTTITDGGFTRSMMIDSGSTYTYIDADLVATIAKELSATMNEQGVYYVPCSMRQQPGYVHFGFNHGNMIINASYSDFIVNFGDICVLGVQPADVGVNTWVLGDTFIRSAYIVFDQMYDAVWLANYQPCGSTNIADLTENAGAQLWSELYGGC